MLVIFRFFQTFGFYGFANLVPTLIAQKGINLSSSLLCSLIIANPFGPLLASSFADRFERKWHWSVRPSASASSACCSRSKRSFRC
jgi:putative MFS transporter